MVQKKGIPKVAAPPSAAAPVASFSCHRLPVAIEGLTTETDQVDTIYTNEEACIPPRPSHMFIAKESSNNVEETDGILAAKKRFQANISNGIDALVFKQGYSRNRAAHLILEQIRQSDAPPEEDKVR
jgi:hypothetical protein